MDRHKDGDPGEGDAAKEYNPIFAAMMEELGVGRLDSLPLADNGVCVTVEAVQASQNKARKPAGKLNAWHNLIFDDVDPSMNSMDEIACGQLYRLRRGAAADQPARGGRVGRGGRGGGRAGNNSGKTSGPGDYTENGSSHMANLTPGRGRRGRDPKRGGGHVDRRKGHSESTPAKYFSNARRDDGPITTRQRAEAAALHLREPDPMADTSKQVVRGRGGHKTRSSPAGRDCVLARPASAYATGTSLASADDFMARMTELTNSNATRIARIAQAKKATSTVGVSSTSTEPTTTVPTASFSAPQVNERSAIEWNEFEDEQGKLPNGWKRLKSGDEKVYYANENTRVSTWERPETSPSPSQSIAVASHSSGLAASRWAPLGFVQKTLPGMKAATAVNVSAASDHLLKVSALATTKKLVQERVPRFVIGNIITISKNVTPLRAVSNIIAYKNGVLIGSGNKVTIQLLKEDVELTAILEITVECVVKLHQVIAKGDIFKQEGSALIFQSIAREGEITTWKVLFPLPYMPNTFITSYKILCSSQKELTPDTWSNGVPKSDTVELHNLVQPESSELLIDFSADDKIVSNDTGGLPESPLSQATQDLKSVSVALRQEDVEQVIKYLDDQYGSLWNHILKTAGISRNDARSSSPALTLLMEREMELFFTQTEDHIPSVFIAESAKMALNILVNRRTAEVAHGELFKSTGFEDEVSKAVERRHTASNSLQADINPIENYGFPDQTASSPKSFLNNVVITQPPTFPAKNVYPIKTTTQYVVTGKAPAILPYHGTITDENKKPIHWNVRQADATFEGAKNLASRDSSYSSGIRRMSVLNSSPTHTALVEIPIQKEKVQLVGEYHYFDKSSTSVQVMKSESPSKSLRSCDGRETNLQHRTGLSEELQALTIGDSNEPKYTSPTEITTKVQQTSAAEIDEILKSRPGLSASRWATDGFEGSRTQNAFQPTRKKN